jgi:methionine biosynthesis protein MetW
MSELKHHYDFPPAFDNPVTTHSIQLRMVPEGSVVLDVGCHSGIFGSALKVRKNCTVVGIDSDPAPLADAATVLDDAFAVNIERTGWTGSVLERGHEGFDAIVFGDVLEHTRDPLEILREAQKLLKPGGRVIVSIPNVAYWRTRLALLRGNFDYTDTGTLDRTHLRFFTHRSARALVEAAGYEILEEDSAGFSLSPWLLRKFPGLLGFQYVCSGRPKQR